MHFATPLSVVAVLATVANAHFQLAFPAPRGVFVEDSEPNFCDDYKTAVDNRTQFPLSGGFITLNSEHPAWTLGIIVSTVQNPTSFDNFTSGGKQQFVFPFSSETGEGSFCLPIDLSASNATGGIKDGQNVTLQFVFDGGDGELFQCADITASSKANISSSITCNNASGSTSGSATAPGSSSTSSSSSGNGAVVGASVPVSILAAGLLAAAGAALAAW